MLVQCGPRPQVVPAKIRRNTKYVPGLLALGGTRLQHGIIHADVFTFRIQPSECSNKLACAKRGRDFLEQSRGHGQMLLQRVRESPRTPNEHPAVPVVVSRVDKLVCLACIRLLGETPHTQSLALVRPSRLDVSVPSFSTSRTDAEHHNVCTRGRDLNATLQC